MDATVCNLSHKTYITRQRFSWCVIFHPTEAIPCVSHVTLSLTFPISLTLSRCWHGAPSFTDWSRSKHGRTNSSCKLHPVIGSSPPDGSTIELALAGFWTKVWPRPRAIAAAMAAFFELGGARRAHQRAPAFWISAAMVVTPSCRHHQWPHFWSSWCPLWLWVCDRRGRGQGWARAGGEEGIGRRPVGWWRRQRGEVSWRSLTSLGRHRGALARTRMKRTASFPADFGALGVGNERSCGWNSGAAQGIRAEFRIQFPRHSKRRNSGPNSVISNSWPNSIHPNGVLSSLSWSKS
jgi:hypothetical protein